MNEIDQLFAVELRKIHDYLDDKIHMLNDDGINYAYQDSRDRIKASPFWREDD